MKMLVIAEDPTHDAFILQPIMERMLSDVQLRGQVQVLRDPKLQGADEALDINNVQRIVSLYPMVDLFVLVVDRDCDRAGHTQRALARCREHPGKLLACVAVEEIEVWMLALHRNHLGVRWTEVREECDPKERFADPLLDNLGTSGPGGGRKRAMRALAGQWKGLLTICPELSDLRDAIRAWAAQP